MNGRTLVLGATGRVGSLVLQELAAAGRPVSGLVRDSAKAMAQWPPSLRAKAQVIVGDLADPDSMRAAMRDVSAVFLASPVHPRMEQWQRDAARAAAQAGVRRIVKLSGSSWTLQPGAATTVGAAHAAVESELRALAESAGLNVVCIRPNAFTQGMLARVCAQAMADGAFSLAIGAARVSFADVRDIAAACVRALVAEAPLPASIEVTGPVAMGGADLARSLEGLLRRAVAYQPMGVDDAVARARATGAPEFVLQHQREVLLRLQAGAGAAVDPGFEQLTGRAARAPDIFLSEAVA